MNESENKRINSTQFFLIMISFLCFWIFLYAAWQKFGSYFSGELMTNMLLIMPAIFLFPVVKSLYRERNHMGLSTEKLLKNLTIGAALSVFGIVLMIFIKLVIMSIEPDFFGMKPFFNFKILNISDVFYISSVVLQEFISRGIMHEGLRRIIPKPYNETAALIISSVFFGAVHLHLGIYYMVGATILLLLFGIIYIRQGSIWGVCVPHYFLGLGFVVLGFE